MLGVAGCSYSAPPNAMPGDAPQLPDSVDSPVNDSPPSLRVTAGLIGLWRLAENGGAVIRDSSNVQPEVNPTITDQSLVTWAPETLTINSPVDINTAFAGTNRLLTAIRASNAVTLEAWVTPANLTQTGTIAGHPARIVTFTLANGGLHDLTLGQDGNDWVAQARTTNVNVNKHGSPFLAASAIGTVTHLVVTADGTGRRLFVNGQEATTDANGGLLDLVDDTHSLVFAGDPGGKNTWLGTMHLVAMYDRALPASDVMTNFIAGP